MSFHYLQTPYSDLHYLKHEKRSVSIPNRNAKLILSLCKLSKSISTSFFCLVLARVVILGLDYKTKGKKPLPGLNHPCTSTLEARDLFQNGG